MLARWGIRMGTSLVGIAAGLIISIVLLSGFSATTTAVIWATLLFWLVHIVIQFIALRILVKQPSVPLAGLLALASTIIALIIVAAIVSGLKISGVSTYLIATLIIWITTAIADTIGRRMIRDRRTDRRG